MDSGGAKAFAGQELPAAERVTEEGSAGSVAVPPLGGSGFKTSDKIETSAAKCSKTKKRPRSSRGGDIEILFNGKWYRGRTVTVEQTGHIVRFDFDGALTMISTAEIASRVRPAK